MLFNDTLPADYPFVNYEVGKKALGAIVNDLAERYTKVEVAASLDALKDAGFHWATRSGVTVSIDDVTTPANKAEILADYEAQAEKVQKQFERGLVTDDERRQELIEIWTQASNDVAKAMEANFDRTNPIYMMVDSGASGNMMQIRQVAAMRGLVANPKGDIIPRPDQGQLPRGPVGPGVLHLHPRCPQGSRRHRAAYRRLGLPDPSSGGRLAGRHHP